MKRIAVLAAAALAVTACGHPLIPASALRAATAPAVASKPAARVPISRPVLGVDLYALSNYPAAQVRFDGQRTLGYIKNVLKADAVGIVWNFYASSDHSNVIERTANTLSARNVGILTGIARQDHLKVEYRPLMFVGTLQDHGWEGKIAPSRPALWFSRYYRAELPYLRVAQRQHISAFITATEMHDLNSSPLWGSFFKRVSGVYHGVTSYTAWDVDYFPPATHLLPARDLGMDMYSPLKIPANASAKRVTAAWEKMFSAVPVSVLRRTSIDETGIEARSGAYRDPPNLGATGQLNERVQANWFTAACATVRRYHLRGVFFWKVDLTDDPASPATSLSTFEGKKGAVAISDCASILH